MTVSKSVKILHESFPYNRNMAHVLYRSTFLENWGSGIHRIIEACQEQGVEEPTSRSYMSPTNDRTKTAQPPTNHRPSTTQVPTKYNRKSPQPRPKFAPSSPQVRQLVELMGKGDYTIKELTELCGFIDPKHFREGYIKPALRENAIEILYADRPNHPKQKYRLTVVAKEWKEFNFKS